MHNSLVVAQPSPELVANWLGALAVAVDAAQWEAIAADGNRSRAAALLTLRESPGIPIGELAAILGISHSACVRLVDGLVAQGLADRPRTAEDARRAQLTLTAAGRSAAARLQRARLQALGGLLSRLAAGERARFAGLVEDLLTGLASDRATARRTCRCCAHRICSGPLCPIGRSVDADAG